MKLLCITDPKTHPHFDTTVELYRRFARNGIIDFFHTPCKTISDSGSIKVIQIDKELTYEEFLKLDESACESASITDFDLIFDRSDKPFPKDYLTQLAKFERDVQFVNRPSSLVGLAGRSFLDRIAGKFMPDYIFTSDVNEAVNFQRSFQQIVAKRNVSYGGKGVYKIWTESEVAFCDNVVEGLKSYSSIAALFETLFQSDSEPYQLMRYLKNIGVGDKRVHVVDGEIYGGYVRMSSTGNWVHNVTAGGQVTLSSVSEREQAIIAETAPYFKQLGIHTLGYDFLMNDDGQWILSEINAGNIGGYDRLEKLSGEPIVDRLINWLIKYRATNGLGADT